MPRPLCPFFLRTGGEETIGTLAVMPDGRSESSGDGATVPPLLRRGRCAEVDARMQCSMQGCSQFVVSASAFLDRAKGRSSVGWYCASFQKCMQSRADVGLAFFLPPRTQHRDRVSVCACRACLSPRHQTFATHTGGQASRPADERGWHKLTRSHSRLLASKRPGTSAPRSRPYHTMGSAP